jgi:eukaryotic-like serine/threonine-protein kinase
MLKPYNKAELTFERVRDIGADGRNSETFLSRDHQLNAEIVTKRIAKASLASPAEFFAESQALYASAHQNVVQIHYACYDDDHIYLAMPFYRRGSVKGLITGRHMTVREIVTVACQVLSGLHHIHSKRLIHFDVKPDNILLSDRGEALVSDFGQAKQMNFVGKAEQDRHYTPMIPPEALTGDRFDLTFDIYQFGLTLYRMCNGNEAFHAQLAKYGPPGPAFDRAGFRYDVRNGRFPDRRAFAPHIPSKLRKVIRACLQTEPSDRYGSALDVANALADIDGCLLDWRLEATADKRVWKKNGNGTSYELIVNGDGSSECYKTKDGGRRQRVTAACQAKISERDVERLLGSY